MVFSIFLNPFPFDFLIKKVHKNPVWQIGDLTLIRMLWPLGEN